jgi:pilus assembly protein Flp/PilA
VSPRPKKWEVGSASLQSEGEKPKVNVKQEKHVMKKLTKMITGFVRDEDGASLIEYSILIGLIAALVIAIIAAVGGWIQNQWSTLNTALT